MVKLLIYPFLQNDQNTLLHQIPLIPTEIYTEAINHIHAHINTCKNELK